MDSIPLKCRFCGSTNLIKRGKKARKQKVQCKDCKRYDTPSKHLRSAKILLLDIETLYMEVRGIWNLKTEYIQPDRVVKDWSILCWAGKFLFEPEILGQVVTPREAINRNESSIIGGIWTLLDQADIVVTQNGCFGAGHKVLKSDLTWCNVEDIKVGDSLVAFNENVPDSANKSSKRKYEISKVEKASPIIKECSKVILKNGKEFIVSNDHPWLVKRSGLHWKYKRTDELLHFNGLNTISKVLDVWETPDSYHAGYLAAFLDGEGTLTFSPKRDNKFGNAISISFAQKDYKIIKKLKESLDYFGFKFSETRHNHKNSYNNEFNEITRIQILGGFSENLRFLGITQSEKNRRLDISKLENFSLRLQENLYIDRIEYIGEHEVIGLQTSSRTYILDGFPVHNTNFDIKKLNTKFLKHGYPPPSPYLVVDTLKVARENFSFTSNKLDELGKQVLGLEGKMKMSIEDWDKCAEGKQEYLDKMLKYCKIDVAPLLEDLYLKFLPWIKNHPNLNIYTNHDKNVCPKCESTDLSWSIEYPTPQNLWKGFRCNACGATGRGTSKEHNIKSVGIR